MPQSILRAGLCHRSFKVDVKEVIEVPAIVKYSIAQISHKIIIIDYIRLIPTAAI